MSALYGHPSLKANTQERQTSEAQQGIQAKYFSHKMQVLRFLVNDRVPIRTILSFSRPEMVTMAHWCVQFCWLRG